MTTPDTEPIVLTTAQVATMCGVTAETVRSWRHRGQGPAYSALGPRTVRYRLRDVMAWIDSQRVSPR